MLKLRWMPSNRRFEFDLSIFIFFVSLFLCFFDNFGNLLGADQEQVVPGQKRVRHGSDCIEHSTWKRSRSAALQRLQGIVWQTPGATMERFHWHHQTQRNSTLSRLSFRLMIADWWSILLMGDGRTEGGGGERGMEAYLQRVWIFSSSSIGRVNDDCCHVTGCRGAGGGGYEADLPAHRRRGLVHRRNVGDAHRGRPPRPHFPLPHRRPDGAAQARRSLLLRRGNGWFHSR